MRMRREGKGREGNGSGQNESTNCCSCNGLRGLTKEIHIERGRVPGRAL